VCEEPLEVEFESGSETNSEAQGNATLFLVSGKTGEAKPRRPKSDEELRLIAERRAIREREREASRPFYRFFYQVSKTRERMQEGPAASDSAPSSLSESVQHQVSKKREQMQDLLP
jgi:hypothetical protein